MPLWLPRLHHGLGRPAFGFSATPLALFPQVLPANGESEQRGGARSSRSVVAADPRWAIHTSWLLKSVLSGMGDVVAGLALFAEDHTEQEF